jgi:hypothetical protein
VKVNEVGKAQIALVKGSFPWSITVGPQVTYADCEIDRTGEILSIEKPVGTRVEVYKANELSNISLELY